MMPTVGRLKRRPDFLKVAAARSKWVTPGLVLQARRRPACVSVPVRGTGPGGEDAEVRVGFTVSRKVGNAVQRNRARRRLRAVAAAVLGDCGEPGCDYVVIGRSGTLDRPYAALVEDMRTAVRRVRAPGRRAKTDTKPGNRPSRRDGGSEGRR
jgi:ribonuclease P protein component